MMRCCLLALHRTLSIEHNLGTPIGYHVSHAAGGVRGVAGDVQEEVSHHVGQTLTNLIGGLVSQAAVAGIDVAGEGHDAVPHHVGQDLHFLIVGYFPFVAIAVGEFAGEVNVAVLHVGTALDAPIGDPSGDVHDAESQAIDILIEQPLGTSIGDHASHVAAVA